ncbi:glycoside hydrolase [Sporomusa termitida]|uniref:Polysaccharide deacetylase n=1 Tax=Sporomusa termitida TaxID=2377 RepID=A0A517DQV6_9FIRM|nr:glycoside hydrolase [Sporomusa termitida]QDR79731.1 hypothetical protein SPTER_10260 [Sporomusa termitida]
MTIDNEQFTARKDRKKRVRVGLQLLIILAVLAGCLAALYTFKTYKPYPPPTTAGDKGFIALAYFGVERTGSQSLIGAGRLREHLQALQALGYVTVTQQDIVNYYQSGQDLPAKSLFLLFEDGRRDTAVFAQKILEDLNFKATMLTYPEKFDKKDTKFLRPAELTELERTTFWEMGTNGYRLAFINVFDRYDNYLGELDPLQHAAVAPYLGRKYNHYLMDYIRDEYGIPRESYNRMKARLTYDYEALRDSYSKSLGYVPGTYILMHANTGSFGNNDKVSAVNEYWIKELFTMNFNREGFSFNQRNSSIYDLTRMQPQAYWHTNHLLMRIKYDINQEMTFVTGDAAKHKAWETRQGALEIQDETMILTSLPQANGLMRLKNSEDFKDLKLSVRLRGNKLGLQKLYLRADENLSRFLSVYLLNNILYVTEKNTGTETELFSLDLDKHDGQEVLSVPEDKKAAELRALETLLKYADSAAKAKLYAERLQAKKLEEAPGVAAGAAAYRPLLSVHDRGDRLLALALKGDRLSIKIDDKEAVQALPVAAAKAGAVYLEAAWGGYGWSQRNLADDVYDGVFEQLTITGNTGADREKILFDSRLQGFAAVKLTVRQLWAGLINWFIVNL